MTRRVCISYDVQFEEGTLISPHQDLSVLRTPSKSTSNLGLPPLSSCDFLELQPPWSILSAIVVGPSTYSPTHSYVESCFSESVESFIPVVSPSHAVAAKSPSLIVLIESPSPVPV